MHLISASFYTSAANIHRAPNYGKVEICGLGFGYKLQCALWVSPRQISESEIFTEIFINCLTGYFFLLLLNIFSYNI